MSYTPNESFKDFFQSSAFGELQVAENYPVYQTDFIYTVNHEQLHTQTTQTGGTITNTDRMAVCNSGSSDLGLAALSSKRWVKYRPGQGVMTRFTALFDTPTVSSIQAVGLSNGENGVLMGYRFNTEFGVWRQYDGIREVRTLTVTTGSSTAEDITITLDGNAVTDVTVTNSGSTSATAWEIAQHDYSNVGDVGYEAFAEGSTVIFVCSQTAPRTGSFTLSGATTAVGTFAQTVAGVSPTVSEGNGNHVLQSNFNVDTLDGNGPSGMTLDPTKGNVFQIDFQYLGFGAINYWVENPETGRFVQFHCERYANNNTIPSLGNVSPVWLMSAYNFTGAAVEIKSASAALYTQGPRVDPIIRYGADVAKSTSSGQNGNTVPLLSVKPKQIYNGVLNLGEALIEEISFGLDSTKPFKVEIIVDGTLSNDASFVDEGGDSMMMYDTSATSITGGIKEYAYATAKDATLVITREQLGEFFINRNKLVTLAIIPAAASDCDASITWSEDI